MLESTAAAPFFRSSALHRLECGADWQPSSHAVEARAERRPAPAHSLTADRPLVPPPARMVLPAPVSRGPAGF